MEDGIKASLIRTCPHLRSVVMSLRRDGRIDYSAEMPW